LDAHYSALSPSLASPYLLVDLVAVCSVMSFAATATAELCALSLHDALPISPTMKSTFAAAAVITFMTSWNNFLWPRVILLDNAVQTMPMRVANPTARYVTDYGALMPAELLTSLPTIVAFHVRQRSFSHGITGANANDQA